MKLIIIALCLSFFGFKGDKEPAKKQEESFLPYEIYCELDHKKAPLEDDKCMKGAYIGDENNYSDIKEFEEYTGVNNDIYVIKISKGDNLPVRNIVDCYAKGKIPLIEIKGSYGISQSEAAAKALGNMNIPLFVEIRDCNIDTYNCIAKLFREHTPKAVLAYGISSNSPKREFPDESLADWVAINAEEKMRSGFIMSQYENISSLCNYYKDKSIMLNISVPNFSTDRCNYAYSEAAEEIERLYSLALDYGNIGAVNYISSIEKNDGIVSCNYRITENPLLTAAYKKGTSALERDRFWSKTPFMAYASDKRVLVSNNALRSLKIKGKYINSGFSEIKAEGFNKSERKIFVKS